MLKILQKLNRDYNNKYLDIKIFDAIYLEENNLLTVKIHYIKDSLTNAEKKEIKDFFNKYFNNNLTIEIKYKKYYLDEEFLRKFLIDYLKEHYKNAFSYLAENQLKIKINDDKFNVKIIVPTSQFKYVQESNLTDKLNELTNEVFFDEISVVFEEKLDETYEEILDVKERFIQSNSSSNTTNEIIKLDISDIENFYNEINSTKAILCSSVNSPDEDTYICGEVSNFKISSFKTKKVDENNNPITKEYHSFDLINDNKKLNCVCFVKQSEFEKFSELESGKKVIINGKIEEYNGNLSVRVKALAYCNFTPPIKVVEIKGVPDKYSFVFPQDYSKKEQSNMFDIPMEPSKFLSNNDVVVFDLETTGIKYSLGHEIVEIGAVKLKNGEIVETFETLIKPKNEIPEEITKINGITNKMVENSISVEQAIPDFFKFCENCTLVAYNIDFDLPFLNHYAYEIGYNFDHDYLDAFALAKQQIPGLKNYKRKTVCNHFNVLLENAHRAIYDTIATAEVFIKLSYNISE